MLLVASDYSGQHKGASFETYSMLFTGTRGWDEWETTRLQLRRIYKVGNRRISFKGLSDSRKRDMLPSFLNAADQLPGLCVVLAVDRKIQSLFHKDKPIDLSSPELTSYSHYRDRIFERLLRIVHFVSFFVAGLSRQNQDVLWFTDQDAIAANDARVVELCGIWSNVLGNYLKHDLRHIKCGTTQCDDGSLQIEDLASVPDLAAGALGALLNQYAAKGIMPSRVLIPAPSELPPKSAHICKWLAYKEASLNRLILMIDEEPKMGSLRLKLLHLHTSM